MHALILRTMIRIIWVTVSCMMVTKTLTLISVVCSAIHPKERIAFLPPSSLKCELLFVDFVYSIGEDWREATPQIVVVDYQGHIHGGGTANVSVFILYLVASWGKLLAPSS